MPQRIMIFGLPGSGKSTYALQLANQLQIPLYHLDKYFFTSNWQKRDEQAFSTDLHVMVKEDNWIIDGNCLQSLEIRYAHATHALYFLLPRWQCLLRLLKRRWHKDARIDDRAENCREIIRWQLLKYLWQFDQRIKVQLHYLQQRYPHVVLQEITKDNQAKLHKHCF